MKTDKLGFTEFTASRMQPLLNEAAKRINAFKMKRKAEILSEFHSVTMHRADEITRVASMKRPKWFRPNVYPIIPVVELLKKLNDPNNLQCIFVESLFWPCRWSAYATSKVRKLLDELIIGRDWSDLIIEYNDIVDYLLNIKEDALLHVPTNLIGQIQYWNEYEEPVDEVG